MSEEIIKVLNALAEKFGLSIDWTTKNIVPYLEQLCDKCVNYELTTSIMLLVVGFILLFLAKIMFSRAKRYYKECKKVYAAKNFDEVEYYYQGVRCVIFSIFCFVATAVGVLVILFQTFDIICCFTFPEKIVIDEIKSIIEY